ncbi:MAG: aspartate carbamoyltransferase regulatory subunit [Prevotellaceae bacterium]|jgi:aspartate carbamoyltransferase regulatory subunit|nr:aspartate carbamoyltransferase regulatory subunit [Prevotellaceae bacterium]
MERELKVSAIKNGTVIDRIPSQALFKVINILGLHSCENQITFGMNLDSKELGDKAIIKVTDKSFTVDEVNRIALVAPLAKLNVIRNYEVVEKRPVTAPDKVENILKCINPKCVTNHENIPTRFVKVSSQPLEMQCCYCEKHIDQEHFEIKQ